MAARRGRSQARRNTGNGGGSLPGWAWLVLGVVLTIGVILVAPKFMKSEGGDGFFRPRPNPDAQPVATDADEDGEGVVAAEADAPAAAKPAGDEEPDYDFYDLLPGEEVALTDAQLAAAAREEQARAQREQQRQAQQQAVATATATTPPSSQPQPLPETPAASAATTTPGATATSTAPAAMSGGNDTPYVLQAGAFGGSGDAEAVKAKIALLGLNARVESAQIGGKTVYRVRMGPYGTATDLAEAKRKLSAGGLQAMAVRVK